MCLFVPSVYVYPWNVIQGKVRRPSKDSSCTPGPSLACRATWGLAGSCRATWGLARPCRVTWGLAGPCRATWGALAAKLAKPWIADIYIWRFFQYLEKTKVFSLRVSENISLADLMEIMPVFFQSLMLKLNVKVLPILSPGYLEDTLWCSRALSISLCPPWPG